jgi:hypothetical protein
MKMEGAQASGILSLMQVILPTYTRELYRSSFMFCFFSMTDSGPALLKPFRLCSYWKFAAFFNFFFIRSCPLLFVY